MEPLLHAGCCHNHFVYFISFNLHFYEVEVDAMPRPPEVQIPRAGKLQSWNLSLGGLSAGLPTLRTSLGCLCSTLLEGALGLEPLGDLELQYEGTKVLPLWAPHFTGATSGPRLTSFYLHGSYTAQNLKPLSTQWPPAQRSRLGPTLSFRK